MLGASAPELLYCWVWGSGEAGVGDGPGDVVAGLLDRVRSRRGWEEVCPGCLGEKVLGMRERGADWEEWGAFSGLSLTHVICAASPRPSILAHQVPNAKKLRRKKQLWERLAKQGELPREVRRAQVRLLNPPPPKAKPTPQDTIERPFYDLWAKDSECSSCHLWLGTGLPRAVVPVAYYTSSVSGGCPVNVAFLIFGS